MKTIKNITYIAVLVTLFVACGTEKGSDEHNHTEGENQLTEINYSVITVSEKQFTNDKMQLGLPAEYHFFTGIKTTGMIDIPPQNKAIISSFAGGRVKNSSLLVGDKVKKGQALVTLENISFIELQQDYLEVAEQIDYLKAEYERQEKLFNEKIASQKVFLKAESDYKTMQSKYLGMKTKLQLLNINVADVEQGKITSVITIYSPIEGSISKLNINSGTYVSPTDEIMEIINTNHIHVELNVFEKDVANVKKGQKILFKVSESSNKTFEAEVHLVGASVDGKTRTVTIHGHLNKDDQKHFLAGMFVEAEILTHQQKALTVPAEAVIERESEYVILVLKQQTSSEYVFEERRVEVGRTLNGYTEIINQTDFNGQDSLLIKGGYSLVGGESGGHSH